MKVKRNFSVRQRMHYWLCDTFNVVSQDYFIEFCENIDRYLHVQNKFNRAVGEKLKLKDDDKDGIDRGMFG